MITWNKETNFGTHISDDFQLNGLTAVDKIRSEILKTERSKFCTLAMLYIFYLSCYSGTFKRPFVFLCPMFITRNAVSH